MRSSKKSKKKFHPMRSSLQGIVRVKGKAGRSELHCSKHPGIGSASLTQTETYTPGCSKDLLPLRMTLISLLAQKEYAKLTIGGKSLHFSPGFILQFFSELLAIRRRASSCSEDQPSIHGSQMDFCSMSKSSLKRQIEAIKLSKSQSNVK